MKNYIIVDAANLFFRAKHVTSGDIDMKIGMAMHIMFNSIRKAWKDFDGDHVVFCLEGRSWRKDYYEPYKANRKTLADQRSPREQEDDELFFEAYNSLVEFLEHKTNVTVLQCPVAEADDLIATWIQMHPQDNHIIVSTDSDFHQLMAPNVKQYNGVADEIVDLDGFINAKTGKRIIDKKTKKEKELPDPEWILFEKCIRGDKSDNIFSAYPGAPKKGTKKRVGMLDAFQDRKTCGFDYNNFMLQRWTDHHGNEHRVRDDYERNRVLIDLTAQPEEIKTACKETITNAINKDKVQSVGIHFMKFTGIHNLQRLSNSAQDFGEILNASIPKMESA